MRRAVIREAFKVGILHRDVSAGNVMLNGDFLGILNDWDHAINLLIEGGAHAFRSVCAQPYTSRLLLSIVIGHLAIYVRCGAF